MIMELAQDAEGPSDSGAGGAGLVFAVPAAVDVFEIARAGREEALWRPGDRPLLQEVEQEHAPVPAAARAGGLVRWKWIDFMATAWKFSEHINLGEMRVTLMWAETLVREVGSRGTRIVCFSDSSAVP